MFSEDKEKPVKVRVGLFSGLQDTNGCNERRHVVEVARASEELRLMHLWHEHVVARVRIEKRRPADAFEDVFQAALFLSAFAAFGRPLKPLKQETWSTGCKYLRTKLTRGGCYGYLLQCWESSYGTPRKQIPAQRAGQADCPTQPKQYTVKGGGWQREWLFSWQEVLGYWSTAKFEARKGSPEYELKELSWLIEGDENAGRTGSV
ncbi:unnamed protein product [Nippostrongylus brasiliensis]|uniref:Pkinase_fungal domain-containing protein n=1 Tax=Nippostrongylus brasiliensis TaxID=27835 RepID=A0A0N4XZM6_NIPBR|nr:unnamed protein product [Nippostrongylus brasiliensis]